MLVALILKILKLKTFFLFSDIDELEKLFIKMFSGLENDEETAAKLRLFLANIRLRFDAEEAEMLAYRLSKIEIERLLFLTAEMKEKMEDAELQARRFPPRLPEPYINNWKD
jgi:hypothetical protein